MRSLFTTADASARGVTSAELRWGVRTGQWRRIERGVYGDGPDEPDGLDRARARVLASGGVASARLAGVLHGLEAVVFDERPTRRRGVPPERVILVEGIRCTDGFQTLVDLAAVLDDDRWEQAVESALRQGLTTVADLQAALPALGQSRTAGTRRIRRVLERRPDGAPPTESLLESHHPLSRRPRPSGPPPPCRSSRLTDDAPLDMEVPGDDSHDPIRRRGGRPMIVTMLEAPVPADRVADLMAAYRQGTESLPPQIVETFLLQIDGGDLWRLVTVWGSREELGAYRASVDTPEGILMFRAAGVEPTLAIFDVAAHDARS